MRANTRDAAGGAVDASPPDYEASSVEMGGSAQGQWRGTGSAWLHEIRNAFEHYLDSRETKLEHGLTHSRTPVPTV